MNHKDIETLEDHLASEFELGWLDPSTDVLSKVTKIVSGAIANPKEPEIDKCAMLGYSSKYVSLADADVENFIVFRSLRGSD